MRGWTNILHSTFSQITKHLSNDEQLLDEIMPYSESEGICWLCRMLIFCLISAPRCHSRSLSHQTRNYHTKCEYPIKLHHKPLWKPCISSNWCHSCWNILATTAGYNGSPHPQPIAGQPIAIATWLLWQRKARDNTLRHVLFAADGDDLRSIPHVALQAKWSFMSRKLAWA